MHQLVTKNDVADILLSNTTIKVLEPNDNGEIVIEGYANTVNKDRVGDIVLGSAFDLTNYEKNPIVLFNHQYDKPVGKMIDHRIDDTGLYFKAVIGKTAEKLYGLQSLITDNIVKAFSIGFKFIDGKYDSTSDTFFITKLELLEVSVVSVPANQDSLFEISKGLKDTIMDKKTKDITSVTKDAVATITTTTSTNSNEDETEVTTIEVTGDAAIAVAALASKTASTPEVKNINGGITNVDTKDNKEAAKPAVEKKVDVAAEVQKALDLKAANDKEVADAKAAKEAANKEAEEALTKKIEDQVAKAIEETLKAQDEDTGIPASSAKLEHQTTNISSKDMGKYEKDVDNLYLLAVHLGKSLTELNAFKKLPEAVQKAVTNTAGSSLAPIGFDTRLEEDVRKLLKVEPMFGKFNMPLSDFRLPFNAHGISAAWTAAGAAPADSAEVFNNILFTAKKLMAAVLFNYEDEDDAVIALLPTIREDLAYAIADLIDSTLVVGTGAGNSFRGVSHYATGANVAGSHITTIAGGAAAVITTAHIAAARAKMGRYGINPRDVRILLNISDYYTLVDDADVKTVQNFGQDTATLRSGELANLYGMQIIPTESIANPAGVGDLRAVIVRPDRFKLGNRGDFMIESYVDQRNQTKVLTASRRMDFNPLVPLTAGQLTATETFIHNITVAV